MKTTKKERNDILNSYNSGSRLRYHPAVRSIVEEGVRSAMSAYRPGRYLENHVSDMVEACLDRVKLYRTANNYSDPVEYFSRVCSHLLVHGRDLD
jgi:hypothetical protein